MGGVARERYERMRESVRALYDRNRQRGHAAWCGYDYDFVCPSMGTYPFQWFWDSCFHTVALSHIDPERARSEVRSLLKNQQPDGFVAHVTFWQREAFEEMLKTYSIAYRTPYLSDCIQPPVLAEAVQAAARGEGGRAFLDEVLPKVRRYYDWLDRVRDPDRDGLIATLQPDESGLDHTPKYDAYLGIHGTDLEDYTAAWERVAGPYATVGRDPEKMFALDRFICEDVLVNTIYGENQRVLGELLESVGDAAGASAMRARAAHTTEGLVSKCYDAEAGLFFDLAGRREERLRVNTVSSLLPLALPDIPARIAERIVGHLTDEREYAAPSGAVGGHERAELCTRRSGNKAGVARAKLDEHELVSGARVETARSRGSSTTYRRPIRRVGRARRVPRGLPPDDGRRDRRAGLFVDRCSC
jgi:hypothetical protein